MRPTTDDFEEFARARTPHLYRTAWLLAGDRHHAEDLVQETLATMFQAWRGLQRIDNPSAYAQTVLARTFISQRRRRSWSEQPTSTLPHTADRQGDAALRLSLQKALAELTPLDRAVLRPVFSVAALTQLADSTLWGFPAKEPVPKAAPVTTRAKPPFVPLPATRDSEEGAAGQSAADQAAGLGRWERGIQRGGRRHQRR